MNVRTVAVGWLSLVVLYTVLERADQAAGAIGWAATALERLASADKGLIPDRSKAAPPPPVDPSGGLDPSHNAAHPGTSIPSPYAPGYTPPDYTSWLGPQVGQPQKTPVTGRH